MTKLHRFVLVVAVAVAGTGCKRRPSGEDPVALGAYLFREKCALCHPGGTESASAPGLGGVVGRKAASLPGFMYSGALQNSKVTWDRATLDVFLRNPNAMVPGTRMPISVSSADERAALIAYLVSLSPPAVAPAASASGAIP